MVKKPVCVDPQVTHFEGLLIHRNRDAFQVAHRRRKLSDSDGEETDDSTASSAPHKQQIYVSSRFCPFEDCESQFLIKPGFFHQV